MSFPYLLECKDRAEGIFFSLVVDAADPEDSVAVAGRHLIANGSLPADGDWFHVEAYLLLRRSGVYATQPCGEFNLTRVEGQPRVARTGGKKKASR